MFSSDKRRRPMGRTELLKPKASSADGLFGTRWLTSVGLPVSIGVITVIAIIVVVGAGRKPFGYRLGQRTDREIRLRVDLRLLNDTKTRNERERAARESQLVFVHHPQPILDLRDRLTEFFKVIAKQPGLEGLDPVLKSEWKVTPAQYRLLAALIPNSQAIPGVMTKVDFALEPLLDYGVLDVADLPTDQERVTERIELYPLGSDQSRFAPRDLISQTELSKRDGPLGQRLDRQFPEKETAGALFHLLSSHLKKTLAYDGDRTQEVERLARDRVEPVFDDYKAGYLVVPENKEIDEEQLRLLTEEHRALAESESLSAAGKYLRSLWLGEKASAAQSESLSSRLSHVVGLAIVVSAVVLAVGVHLRVRLPAILSQPARLAVLAGLAVTTLALMRLMREGIFHLSVLPLAMTSLLLAIAFNQSLALTMAVGLSLIAGMTSSQPMASFVTYLGGTAVGIMVLDHVRSRTKLITVGFWSGLAYAILSLAMGLLADQPWILVLEDCAWRFGGGLIAGFLISGSLPFVEQFFSIVTDISLIELADTSHPLLQELIRRAPGTYNHSVTVSIIAEAAATKIGCNSLLVRVGALFHDIGKMLKPNYFIENKTAGERNRHDQLAPALSTLIIIGHVKDGMDLALQHHLPDPILAMIEQHHGTTLVDYFYQEAAREAQGQRDPDEEVQESAFRYPGPRPRSKEAAVLMMADCVESASRALSEPTPASIEKLVHNLTLNRLLDGQFNESGLTLQEVEVIEESLTKSLTSVYHGRIRYPAAG